MLVCPGLFSFVNFGRRKSQITTFLFVICNNYNPLSTLMAGIIFISFHVISHKY